MKQGSAAQVAVADTNVFIALFAGPTHPLHEDSLALFRRVAESELTLTVTPLIVAELVYAAEPVLGWNRGEAASRLSMLLEADGLAIAEQTVLLEALELYRQKPKLDFADAYLAATVLRGPAAVASFDTDFDAIDGIKRIAA